jgi:hypothetical protein
MKLLQSLAAPPPRAVLHLCLDRATAAIFSAWRHHIVAYIATVVVGCRAMDKAPTAAFFWTASPLSFSLDRTESSAATP